MANAECRGDVNAGQEFRVTAAKGADGGLAD